MRELSEEEQTGNDGERDCPNAWTTHSVQDKSTTYILITYFPIRGTLGEVEGTFVRYLFPSKFNSSTLNPDSLTHELHGILNS